MVRLLGAAASGGLLYLSYAPHGLWWCAILGLALFFSLLRGQSARGAALLGGVHACVLYGLLLPWIGAFVGVWPLIALIGFLATFSIAFAAVAPAVLRSRASFALLTCWYLSVETIRSTVPFGGFAWVRVAWGQIDGPVAFAAPLGGPALISFLTASLAACLAVLCIFIVQACNKSHRAGQRRMPASYLRPVGALVSITAITGVLMAGAHLPGRGASSGEVRLAAVQGNTPPMRLDAPTQRLTVLANHSKETRHIDGPVDAVIWPENSADVDPFTNARAARLVDEAVRAAQAPVLVGAVTRDSAGDRNQMRVFNADGTPGEFHNKKYLQPFGEYVPLRSLFRAITSLVDYAGNFQPGTGSGVVHFTAARTGARIALGVTTCYEVAFDAAGREAVRAGAQILTTPTNNATFGYSDMSDQQLAMSRLRARELDRAVVVAATSGISAMVMPDGSVVQRTELFTPAVLEETLPLHTAITPAVHWGTWLERALAIIGCIALFTPWTSRRSNPL